MKPSSRAGFLELDEDDLIQPGDVIYLSQTNMQVLIDSRSVLINTRAGAYPNTVFQRKGSSMQLPSSRLSLDSPPPAQPATSVWYCNGPQCTNRQNDLGHACYWCGVKQ